MIASPCRQRIAGDDRQDGADRALGRYDRSDDRDLAPPEGCVPEQEATRIGDAGNRESEEVAVGQRDGRAGQEDEGHGDGKADEHDPGERRPGSDQP